jgi:monoterpene epsilon-lactone hydrolase
MQGSPLQNSRHNQARAHQMFPRVRAQGRHAPPLTGPIATSRSYCDRINSDRADRILVKIENRRIGGVLTGEAVAWIIAGKLPVPERSVPSAGQ